MYIYTYVYRHMYVCIYIYVYMGLAYQGHATNEISMLLTKPLIELPLVELEDARMASACRHNASVCLSALISGMACFRSPLPLLV